MEQAEASMRSSTPSIGRVEEFETRDPTLFRPSQVRSGLPLANPFLAAFITTTITKETKRRRKEKKLECLAACIVSMTSMNRPGR